MDNEILIGGGSSFISYMFSFSEGEKIELLNMFQYLIIAIIPILLLFKLTNIYLPPVDKKKSTIEITVEVVVQLVVLFSFFFFIHKLIIFFPTYTNQPYPTLHFLPVVLPILFILFSLDKNLSEKVSIVLNRVLVMVGLSKENFEDGSDLKENERNQPQVNQNVNPQFSGGSYTVAPPPQMSNPSTSTYDQPMYEQPNRKSDQNQQQHGIPQYMNEPVAANEVGFTAF